MFQAPVESTRGVLYYQLSNRECIEKGWTVLPTTNILRKVSFHNEMAPIFQKKV